MDSNESDKTEKPGTPTGMEQETEDMRFSQKSSDVNVDDIRRQVSRVGDELSELTHKVRGITTGKLRSASSSLSGLFGAGVDRAKDTEGDMVDWVRNRPVKSLLIAAGIGVLLGLVLPGRRS